MKKYCLGFLFNDSKTEVRLVLKNRPEWQAGKWNGIGGHIEDETPAAAMVRETLEECGVSVEWQYAGLMESTDWSCYVYTSCLPYQILRDVNDVGEMMEWWSVTRLPSNIIANVRFLVPFCQRRLDEDMAMDVVYPGNMKATELGPTL